MVVHRLAQRERYACYALVLLCILDVRGPQMFEHAYLAIAVVVKTILCQIVPLCRRLVPYSSSSAHYLYRQNNGT